MAASEPPSPFTAFQNACNSYCRRFSYGGRYGGCPPLERVTIDTAKAWLELGGGIPLLTCVNFSYDFLCGTIRLGCVTSIKICPLGGVSGV